MSVIATALKHMMAAGMAPEAIIAAVADMEAELCRDSQAERRRAADRERKRKALRVSENSDDSADSAEFRGNDGTDDKEGFPQTPFQETNTPLTPNGVFPPSVSEPVSEPAKPAKAKKGTRLPRGWRPEPLPDEFRVNLGLSVSAVEREFEKFTDYWQARAGPNGVKLDWNATWRNWLRKAAEDQHKGQGHAAYRNCRPSIHEVARDEFERLGGEIPDLLR